MSSDSKPPLSEKVQKCVDEYKKILDNNPEANFLIFAREKEKDLSPKELNALVHALLDVEEARDQG